MTSTERLLAEDKSTVKKSVLGNGLRIITEEINTISSVSLGIWINAGSRDETVATNGIAHFLEHAVFKGTKKRSGKEIAYALESVGGYINAFTGKEHTCYYAKILSEHVEKAFDVLSDLVLYPKFPRQEIEKERQVILEEIHDVEDTPDDIIFDYFERNLYPSHPLGFPVIGSPRNVRGFSRNDLVHFVDSYYHPENIVVAAAGNISHERVEELVYKKFGRLSRRKIKNRRLARGIDRQTQKRLVIQKQVSQSHLCLGTIVPGIHGKDRYPLVLLNTMLGEGMSSRLYQNIRERRGIAYSVYSFLNLFSDSGAFGVYLGTDKKNLDRALDAAQLEIQKMVEKPVRASELQRAKNQIKGNMILGLESMSNRMMRLGTSELYYNNVPSLSAVIKEMDQVSPAHVYECAKKRLRNYSFSAVVIQTADMGEKPQ